MIYDVTHVTRYTYGSRVEFTNGILRLTPESRNGQSAERFLLDTKPASAVSPFRIDAFGNTVAGLRIETPHRELVVQASSRVEVRRPPPPQRSPHWERVAEEALAGTSLEFDSPPRALYPSRLISLFDAATAYARRSFSAKRPIYEAALELSERIRSDFIYDPGATDVTTPPEEAFSERRGVCQDFAHVMIAALRGLSIPARYVSGYIRTTPPPGKPRLAGADASHAWVSVWCGDHIGWRDFDPTNGKSVMDDYIVVAHGRDYSDASPIESVVLSSGSHDLEVEVDVVPVARPENGQGMC